MKKRDVLTALALVALVGLLAYTYHAVKADSSSYALGPNQAGWISCTQATCQSSATTFLVASATTLYRINAAVACTSTGAAATSTLTIRYTDPSSTVQTITLSTATCTALGSLSVAALDQGVMVSSGTNIQYSVATANSPNYQSRIAVYQEGVN